MNEVLNSANDFLQGKIKPEVVVSIDTRSIVIAACVFFSAGLLLFLISHAWKLAHENDK